MDLSTPQERTGAQKMRFRKIYLEIGNVCNLRCSFCPGTRREPHLLSPEEFHILASKVREYTEYLYFHLMGEPLLHPELAAFLDESERLAFKVMITTNGTLLPKKGKLLLDAPAVHKVNLSLQSYEANTSGELESYLRGCTDFVKEAASRGILCEFRLWNQGGLNARNQEILAFLHRAFREPWRESRNGQKLAQRVWLDPGERFDWPDLELNKVQETGFCYGLRDQIGVLCDGTVVPCCLDHEGDIPLGNLFQQELRDILESPRARAIYEGFSARKVVEPLCKRCGYATRFQK